jgi:2-polyprenyl-3-methyl-5-hydroxy-6-metoxy-1,4-benzoquinol methylase/glycosyltransferase involved in cell wall biosynthesis
MPDSDELKAYYDREQWFEGGEPGGYQDYERQTAWSVKMISPLLEEYADRNSLSMLDLSILDVGCGYGAHLELAANLRWKCFGVELSKHARGIAQKRLGGRAYIVESVADLIPHEFDVVLMLDVIEHLPEPYALFYSLFSIGAITPKTRLVITTPNAGSSEAQQNPAAWAYRHPPSHLVYYREEALRFLLNKLHFTTIDIQGEHPLRPGKPEELAPADYGGLRVHAYGSNFIEFMRERYVPGTWSKIAEYEHLPRYELAKRVAVGKSVLDFGCGTGYGSAALATVAAHVTGLDIDASAIAWAKATHAHSGLEFHRCDDLGASLPPASFDVVTCFEMIEHVDFDTQRAAVAAMARLLRQDGVLIISTPNPAVTSLYGANPYHLREMTREEFHQLLTAEFPYIRILEQRVRHSIAFDIEGASPVTVLQTLAQGAVQVPPVAYIAFCSRQSLPDAVAVVMFDETSDVIRNFLQQEQKMNAARLTVYSQAKQVEHWHRLGEALCNKPLSWGGMRTIVVLVAKLVLPGRVKQALHSIVSQRRQRRSVASVGEGQAYVVKHPKPALLDRPRIIHVIANFCVGGSSRLVVDLLERLGQYYEQSVVTSYIPSPPAYRGLEITELRHADDEQPFVKHFRSVKPVLIHIHYWGDSDEPWYAKAIAAAERLDIPVVENINTPIAPYFSPAVQRYVYVSDYVRREFGKEDPVHVTIYPGSDFSHFAREPCEVLAENCVGMVCRLERDKLNEASILPFIRAVQKRPATKVLIVGGGSLLEGYRQAVQEAGLSANFEFTGYVSYASLPGYYRRMTVFVAPVWKESFGQVSSFAMNMKIPVCGYNVGAIGEIVADPSLMARAGDVEGLASIIIRLLDSAEERTRIGELQHARAQAHFSVEAMIQAYSNVYRELTGVPG